MFFVKLQIIDTSNRNAFVKIFQQLTRFWLLIKQNKDDSNQERKFHSVPQLADILSMFQKHISNLKYDKNISFW